MNVAAMNVAITIEVVAMDSVFPILRSCLLFFGMVFGIEESGIGRCLSIFKLPLPCYYKIRAEQEGKSLKPAVGFIPFCAFCRKGRS
jgi:hypothetical protein